MRNPRLRRTSPRVRTARMPLQVCLLEDRTLPGDTLLGALAAHGLLPNREVAAREVQVQAHSQITPQAVNAPEPPGTAWLGGTPWAEWLQDGSNAPQTTWFRASFQGADLFDSSTEVAIPRGVAGQEPTPLYAGPGGSSVAGSTPASSPVLVAAGVLGDLYQWLNSGSSSDPGPGNGDPGVQAPNPPNITEPSRDGLTVNPADVHMETGPFSDPRPGATHAATEWEIYDTAKPAERVWSFRGTNGGDLVHVHLGDGQFEGSHKGRDSMIPETDYRLRVRFENNFGELSTWSQRDFRTAAIIIGNPDARWAVRQAGYRVEVVATDFRLPVNMAFVPNPGPKPDDPLYYVTELYGTIKVVSNNGTVSDFATNLLNFNPTGQFPGSGEQGLTGIAVDPDTGDVYASMVYSLRPFDDASPHYGKVSRFTSADGGRTAATQQDIFLASGAGEEQGQSHQISNVTLGPDRKLYVHNGEGFDASRALNFNRYGGKILRMNLDGTPVPTNPFYQNATRQPINYIWAYGLRNPFGGAWRATYGDHFQAENGPGAFDRFARVQAGMSFSWTGDERTMTANAAYNWQRPTAPVNVAFVEPQVFGGSGFPAEKFASAFVTESGPTYGQGPQQYGKKITEFQLDENGRVVVGPTPLIEYVGTGRATATALAAGPDGLYFADLYRDDGVGGPTARGANVYRIQYVGKAEFTQDVTAGSSAPLTVQFADLSDPAPKSWFWDFGDGTHSEEQYPKHTYEKPGIYSVELTVIGSDGLARTVTKQSLIGTGDVGLRGQFYNFADPYDFNRGDWGSLTYNGTGPLETRIDPTVNFNYTVGNPPHPNVRITNLVAQWTGLVRSRAAGVYTFTASARDGARLWVNNQLIVNNWAPHGGQTTTNGTVTLGENEYYAIRYDVFHGGGAPSVQLRWTPPGEPQEIIPANHLAPLLDTTSITPPSSLRLGAVNDTFVELNWYANSPEAAELILERSRNGGAFEAVLSLPPTETAYTDYPETGGLYQYRLRAQNEFGSVLSNLTPLALFRVPAAPTNLNVTEATLARVAIAWTASSANHTGFRIERSVNGGAFTQVGEVAADVRTFADTTLANGNAYTYRVLAFNDFGAGLPSLVTQVSFLGGFIAHDVGAVGLPGGLGYTAANGTYTVRASGADIWDQADQMHFAYQAVTGDAEIVARVRTLVRSDYWTKAGVMIRDNLTPGSRHLSALLTPGPDHHEALFQRRLTQNGGSASTDAGVGTAPLPYWVRLVRQGNNFSAYRSANGTTWVQTGPTITLALPATVFWGLAVTSHNNTLITTTEIDNVSITLLAPSNLRATSVTGTEVNLAWNDNSNNETGFRIERSSDGTNFTTVGTVAANQTTFTDLPAQGGQYTYRIRSFNAQSTSVPSNSILISFRVPLAPTNARITGVTIDSATLAWNDNSNNETGFRIERSVDGTNWTVVTTTAANVTTFTNSGLTANTYRYRVLAVNAEGNSQASNVAVAAVGVIDYSGGFLPAGRINLVTNGVAAYQGNSVRLTPAVESGSGNLFTLGRTNVARFSATFDFQIRPGTDPMADGMTFCIQGGTPNVLANGGNGLGYGPDSPGQPRGIRNSIAIKFDIYNLAGEGDNSTGLFTDGRSPSVPEGGSGDVLNRIDPAVVDLKSRNILRVNMTYNGTVLQVTITDTVTTRSVTHNYTVNIPAQVGGTTAHVGFTGGTGSLTALNDVHNFRFTPA